MVLREVSKIDVNYVKKLYKEAFPIRERMPFSRLLKLQKNNIIKIFAAYENGEPCALAITCTGSKSVLLMCTSPLTATNAVRDWVQKLSPLCVRLSRAAISCSK